MKTSQQAIKDNDMPALKDALKHISKNTYFNGKDDNGFTLLALAAKYGRVEMLKLLIESGADCNALSGQNINLAAAYEVTPLFIAVSEGHAECAKELIDAGADVNYINNDAYFKTALAIAAFKGHPECVNILLQAGAKISVETHKDLFGFQSFRYTAKHSALDAAIDAIRGDPTHDVNVRDVLTQPWTFRVYNSDKSGSRQCLGLLCQKIVDDYTGPQAQPEFRELMKTILELLLGVGNETKDSVNRVHSLLNSGNFTIKQLQQAKSMYPAYNEYVTENNQGLKEELIVIINAAIENLIATNKDKKRVVNPHYSSEFSDSTTPLLQETPKSPKSIFTKKM